MQLPKHSYWVVFVITSDVSDGQIKPADSID